MKFLKHYAFSMFGILVVALGFFEIRIKAPIEGLGMIIFGCTLMICQFLKDIVLEMVMKGHVDDLKKSHEYGVWPLEYITKEQIKKKYPDEAP